MARSFGRLFTSIWDDDDFRPLGVGAKLMYGFLISQDDIAHSGIIPWIPQRWAKLLGEPVEDVLSWLKELEETCYVVTDEEVGELLVRSLIRRDDIWKQPNVFKAAAASAKASKSPRIKAALYYETRRLTLVGTGRETHALRDELLSHLEPFANRSPNPPEGFPRGSGGLSEPSGNGSGTPGEPPQRGSREGAGGAVKSGFVDNSAGFSDCAGQNPSRTLSEGQANPSAGPQGKGSSYGPVLEEAFPHSPTPSPVAATELVAGPRLAVVPDVQAEGEDQTGDETPDLTAVVARVRGMRPDWSTKSITRAMAGESVAERPWPLAVAAMLAVAADPASEHPGRVAHDGPWWKPPAREAPKRPPWCEQCRESTRRLEDEDGYDAGPCPRCNPRAEAS